MEPKNEVNAKVRAGPRGRGQRQNPEQMVQTLHERTSQNGMGPKEETTAAEDCEFPHGKALHLTDKCGQIRTDADKCGQHPCELLYLCIEKRKQPL